MEQGNECGLAIDRHKDFLPGDEVECLRVDWVKKKLSLTEVSTGAKAVALAIQQSQQKKFQTQN